MSMIPARQAGFSMLEVLVALIVISLGLLGIAAMQAASINNTSIARSRSLGAITAESMAAAMHANTAYWGALTASGSWSVGPSGVSGTPTLSQTVDCAAATCSAANLAGYDANQWASGTLKTLPSGSGQIVCSPYAAGSTPVGCTITVTWLEKNSAVNAAGAASGTVTQSYQMVVVP
ncbi:type IV pilus modification protein PilV [Chromobacterium phragmitis]|uniref:Type IV pilus modification protein PilV n=1 Tax=Chromobacterium phragmitis TaxID=2202141 RepID=A0A344UF10_9NEIS|nr:type IV pilus modification protein PilV [Chromobacterium phragmitis]AXE33858.1 type IV pilus modification protein PilV [Chromobacterium phragmitis]